MTYPFESTTQLSTGNTFAERVTSLEVNTDVAERMRVPGQNVHDFSIEGRRSTTVPIEIVNNHIYLDNVIVDGRGPYRSCSIAVATTSSRRRSLAALQARSTGSVQLQGVGNTTEGAAFAHIGSLAVGNAVVRNQYTLVLPIASGFGVAEGMKIDGMIGYQFLARFLTTIDYANSKLTLANPRARRRAHRARRRSHSISTIRYRASPLQSTASSTSAEVDTGNRAGLELSSPFLAAHAAIAALAKTPPGVVGFGVGGPAYARLGRVPTLQIGPYAII